jgi:hypothetical protein
LFLAHNRARNDASNRNEFLQSLAEKRRRLNPDGEDPDVASMAEVTSSCARTDAKSLDRDVQMKYDIAKNEEGPLRRTVKVASTSQDVSKSKENQRRTTKEDSLSRERHPGLDERLVNMETHLAVRYGEHCPHWSLSKVELNNGIKFLCLPDLFWTDSNSWKTTSSGWRKNTHLGRPFTSINPAAE